MTGSDETVAESTGRPETRPLERGDTVGRYVVLSHLGAGGMGVVYAAYDPELDRKIALKLLHTDGSSGTDGRDTQRRLVREAQAMAKLAHPNVITIHDVGEHQGRVFVAMEFVEGTTLAQWLNDRDRARAEVLDVFGRAGLGLAAAHAKGLVHRDFKPDNVMVGSDGRVRVMDFGLARAAAAADGEDTEPEAAARSKDELHANLTAAGSAVGTPAYMAPEQHLMLSSDARTDQFSFCVALYEALYGERPFAGETTAAVADAVTSGEIRDAPARSNVPRWLRSVLVRGLATAGHERWATMDELLAELAVDPSRTRWRWLAAGAIVLVGGGILLSQQLVDSRETAVCDGLGKQIYEHWTSAQKQRIHASLRESGVEFSETTWKKLTPWLDRYAASWDELRAQVCVATEVEATRSEELRGRSLECLNEGLDAFAALVGVLGESDARSVQHAIPSAAGLPRISACLDDTWLMHRMPPPSAEAASAILSVRKRLAEAKALGDASFYARGLEVADAARREADQSGHAPLQASALEQVARLTDAVGRPAEAAELLEDAFFMAGRVGDDYRATKIAVALVALVGLRLDHVDDGMRWAQIAKMLARRSGTEHGPDAALLWESIGAIQLEQGAFEEADRAHRQALELREEILGTSHPLLATSLYNIGLAQRGLENYDEAVRVLEDARVREQRVLGPNHPRLGRTLAALGSVFEQRRDLPKALQFYEQALTNREHSLPASDPDLAASRFQVARTLWDTGGDQGRATSLASQAQAGYGSAGPDSDKQKAAVEAWLASHHPPG